MVNHGTILEYHWNMWDIVLIKVKSEFSLGFHKQKSEIDQEKLGIGLAFYKKGWSCKRSE